MTKSNNCESEKARILQEYERGLTRHQEKVRKLQQWILEGSREVEAAKTELERRKETAHKRIKESADDLKAWVRRQPDGILDEYGDPKEILRGIRDYYKKPEFQHLAGQDFETRRYHALRAVLDGLPPYKRDAMRVAVLKGFECATSHPEENELIQMQEILREAQRKIQRYVNKVNAQMAERDPFLEKWPFEVTATHPLITPARLGAPHKPYLDFVGIFAEIMRPHISKKADRARHIAEIFEAFYGLRINPRNIRDYV